MKSFYQLTADEVISQLKSDKKGLAPSDVKSRQKEHGKNVLEETKKKSKLAVLLSQFTDVMILVLVIAAIISFVAGEHTDAFVILAIIVANAWMGFSQETNAEESIRMLKKMAAQHAMVIRDNNPSKIEAGELVPGDIIVLEAGDIIPADARIISAASFKTDESSLTGESNSIEKITDPIDNGNLVPGDQLNMVFKGTNVSNGTAKAIVTSTGMHTEMGKIAGMMDTVHQKTPLQKRLSKFSKQLAIVVMVICALVFGVGLWRGEPAFSMFLTALSLAVAALPEALPAVITIALALGAKRMVKQKALIRKLPAVETLGSVTYICTDKTGTLTQNVMTVQEVLYQTNQKELLLSAMMLNNQVRFDEDQKLLGDSTETAMVQFAISAGHVRKEDEKSFPLVTRIPFDSERMRMSTLHKHGDKWILFVKGAPIKMLEILAKKYEPDIPTWRDQNRIWAEEGMRVLFFGFKVFNAEPANPDPSLEKDLDFLGITALIDPPREEVIESIRQCKSAGIRIVMITGDQALTAKAIAERLDLFNTGSNEVVTGADLDTLNEEEFAQKVKNISVYARVSPEQKLNIVKALQHDGQFVAMTGDGVNDAPSLKQSDIGLAMGITGTDVAKEASDMILLDDNFNTIVKAVREGRRIYDNIRKFIQYVLSCNLSEILTIFIAPLLGFAVPLIPIHILWINLVTDGLPGVALVSEQAEKNIMNKPPRHPDENLFAGGLIQKIILSALVMTAASLFIQWWGIQQGYDVRTQRTMVFTTLCFVQLGNALSSRSNSSSIFTSQFLRNIGLWVAILSTVVLQLLIIYVPFLNRIFKTSPLDAMPIMIIVAVTLISIGCVELMKIVKRRPIDMHILF